MQYCCGWLHFIHFVKTGVEQGCGTGIWNRHLCKMFCVIYALFLERFLADFGRQRKNYLTTFWHAFEVSTPQSCEILNIGDARPRVAVGSGVVCLHAGRCNPPVIPDCGVSLAEIVRKINHYE